jgi:drug/metabolite transporter (DMT)-like permease
VAAVAVLDLGGNVFYILATQAGRLDIAATTSSLYPVTTLVLALIVLRERVDRWHAAGILAAVGSIVLITTGSGG